MASNISSADTGSGVQRSQSFSQNSESSQTAQEYIASQLSLEADAREALPYQFDSCTKPLGPLRQSVYACLTCTPAPASVHQQFTPAGVCYSCSISCHGEHNLVELFGKRDFVCDCGTTRMSNSGTACTLRRDAASSSNDGVTGEEARVGNKYNQNFKGKFCGCGEEYDPEKEKGTMFQCMGLGHVEDGGCGEDWWHPECLMGLPRRKTDAKPVSEPPRNGALDTVREEAEDENRQSVSDEPAQQVATEEEPPPGFPDEDDFDHLICYKCANAFPWIKQYAGTAGFLPALPALPADATKYPAEGHVSTVADELSPALVESKKRKVEAVEESADSYERNKRVNSGTEICKAGPTLAEAAPTSAKANAPKHKSLPPAPSGSFSIFVKEGFREHLCHCSECFPHLARYPQLLEEEDTYEPPVSESDHDENRSIAGRSVNSGSLLDRGEAALSSMDRVRAIEGVMAYNHVRDKVKAFLQPFAASGQPVGAEDIKAYFAQLRGDEQAMREAAVGAGNGAVQGDGRKEQD